GGGPEMQMGAGGGRFNGGGGRGPASTGAPQAQVQTPAANPEAVVEAEGKWAYVIESPQGGDGTITIVKDGESLSGTIFNKRFNRETTLENVKLNGNELTFNYQAGPMGISVRTIVEGDSMNGSVTVGEFGTFPLKATREK